MEDNLKANVKAIVSIIIACLSILCCCFWSISMIFGVVAVVLGILAIRGDNPNQQDAAIAGIVVGAVGFALAVAVAVMTLMIYMGMADGEIVASVITGILS
ncbi:MAG: hypothetical protein J1F22_00310 [Lachnospiraceae bacterium]|nr:hypothetical protein [Lachnospiraceae bacterium]